MNPSKVLLNAYWEALYRRLAARRRELEKLAEELLGRELRRQPPPRLDRNAYDAYVDACLSFIDERLETYNPIGIQYAFDADRRSSAAQLELQLDWYDSRAEFESLLAAVERKAALLTTDDRTDELVDELIAECGAFPDRSIISTYEAAPSLSRLPDYIVARAIEQVIRADESDEGG